jgi:predicted metal-binding membrane protein
VPDQTTVAALGRRDRLLVAGCIGVIAALAWAYLIHLDQQMSASMEYDRMMADMGMAMNEPWHAADVLFAAIMWTVMMIGMMAPSAAPVLLLFAASVRSRQPATSFAPPLVAFAAGYVLVWTAFSAVAALAQWVLHDTAMLSSAMAASSGWLSGAILIGAGVYQFTPLKGACLTQCRSPLGFLMGHWRSGTSGALRMGLRHGAECLGCCWALMCVLFVVGVMNLLWVATISAFVLLEKVGPRGVLASRLAGVAAAAAGLLLLARVW